MVTNEELNPAEKVRTREQYNRWAWWAVGIGTAGFVLGIFLWTLVEARFAYLSGLAIYYIGFIVMLVLMWRSPVSLSDELDEQIESEAMQIMFAALAGFTIIGLPGSITLDSTGIYTMPTLVEGALLGYALLVCVYVVAHWHITRQYH